jgi:hypothetical protein
MQGEAGRKAAHANARIAEQNRDIATQQSAAEESRQRTGARYALGRQAAAQAESGIDATSGSAARVSAESGRDAELDALNIRYRGMMQGFGYEREMVMQKHAGQQAQRQGYFTAATAIAGAAAKGYAGRAGGSTPLAGGGSGGGYGFGIDNLSDRWGP